MAIGLGDGFARLWGKLIIIPKVPSRTLHGVLHPCAGYRHSTISLGHSLNTYRVAQTIGFTNGLCFGRKGGTLVLLDLKGVCGRTATLGGLQRKIAC